MIAVLLGGCAGQSPPSPAPVAPASTVAPASPVGSFVGAVPGTDAYIALITDGRRLAGYVCANGEVSSWFAPADLTGDTAALTGRDGTPRGTVTITATGATGEVRIDGQPHPFTADPAQGVAGLYRATVGEPGQPGFVEAGWVVANDLTQRGSATTHNAEDDLDVDPAPTLEPRQPLIRLNESVVEAIKNPPINIGDQNQQDANQNSGGATSSTPATSAPQTQPPQTQTPQTQPPQTRPPAPSGGG